MKIEELIEQNPWARERKNKYKAIADILERHHGVLKFVGPRELAEIVSEAVSMDRMWRHTLFKRPELRGSDYDDKDALEEKAKEELGYTITP